MFRLHADIFKVLSVESRLKILHLIKTKGPLCVNDLAEALDLTPSAVSQHLKVLKHAGLVRDERQGYYIPYNINIHALEDCGKHIVKICSCDSCCEHDNDHPPVHEKNRIEILKKYEEELKRELDDIRKRIEELKSE